MSRAPARPQDRGFTRQTARPPVRKKKKGGRSIFGWISFLSSAVMSLAAVVLVGALLFIIDTNRPGPSAGQEAFVVPRGASVSTIARLLSEEHQVRNPLVFRVATMIYANGKHLQAGEYEIAQGASVRTIVAQMADGGAVQHPITAAEGLTSAMIVDIVAGSDVLTGDVPAVPPEGSLLPETYNVQRGMERGALISQMQEAQRELIEELWPRRADGLPFSTPEEAVILASIVEKETGVAEERPRVAAVFVNRLKRGMRLESDPTIIYGLTQGRPLGRGIRASELARRTAYNTYQIDGLPPTPIANPGRASIEAVLNPPATRDLFFVADGSGGHVFAATVAEHNRNVAAWRALERTRAAGTPSR
jgi:UPF0755 protein